MKKFWLILIGVFLCALLGFTANAVVAAKMYELRLRVYRDQIMDFRFSSELTRARLMSLIPHRDDHRQELRTAAAESSLFRAPASSGLERMTLLQKSGLAIVNAARQLCLKAGIRILDEAFALASIQNAFFLERNEFYSEAAAEYVKLEDHRGIGDEERAFSMVHAAFCQAVQGSVDEAVPRLERVVREFPGTVFEEDARLILDLLRSARETRTKIFETYNKPEERARALFSAGQYAESLKQWKETRAALSDEDRYARAFALEKTGSAEEASKELIELAATAAPDVARRSNRRLLMIAYAYAGGEKMKDLAEKNSVRLGDDAAAQEIKQGASRLIPYQASDAHPAGERSLRLDSIVQTMMPPPEPAQRPGVITLYLTDGRLFPAASGQRMGGRFQVELATGAKLTVPFVLVDRVAGESPMKLEQGSDSRTAVSLKRRENGFEVTGEDQTSTFTAEDFRIRLEGAH
jgi:tetratricopeptide (TPR) repeat protein